MGHATLTFSLLPQGETAEARESAEKAVELAPGDDAAQLALALVEFADGSVLAALERLREAMRLDPNPSAARLYLLGSMNYRVGRIEKAVELWERAQASSPDYNPDASRTRFSLRDYGQPQSSARVGQ